MPSLVPGSGYANPPSSHSDYCLWKLSGGLINLVLRLRVVDWLNDKVAQSLKATTKGAEVGGILLGRIVAGRRPLIIIEGFEPVPSIYENCPLYHLSARDRSLLKEHLNRWTPDSEKNMYAVGYYRSHNREGLALDAQDLDVADEFFPDPTSIFLLIKPVAAQASIGGFLCRESGSLRREPLVLLPFNSGRLRAGEKEIKVLPPVASELSFPCHCPPAVAAAIVPSYPQPGDALALPQDAGRAAQDLPPPSETQPAPQAPPPVEQIWSQSAEIGKISAPDNERILSSYMHSDGGQETGGYVVPELPSEVFLPGVAVRFGARKFSLWDEVAAMTRSRSWPLTLSLAILVAVFSGAGYVLWPRLTPPVLQQSARDSTGLNLKVEKQRDQLRISWSKESPWVKSARRGVLSVADGSSTRHIAVDSNQLNSGSIPYANKTDDVTFRLQLIGNDTQTSEWIRVVGINRQKADLAAGRPVIKPPSMDGNGSVPREARKGRELKPAGLWPVRAAGPKALTSTKDPAKDTLSGEAISGVVEQTAGQSAAAESVAPKPGEATDTPTTQPNTGAARPEPTDSTNYEEPKPLRQIDPDVPPDARQYIPGLVRIKVKVYVDDHGTVTRAEPADQEKPPPYLTTDAMETLTNVALDTARKWLFSPARKDGRMVESVAILEFQFGETRK